MLLEKRNEDEFTKPSKNVDAEDKEEKLVPKKDECLRRAQSADESRTMGKLEKENSDTQGIKGKEKKQEKNVAPVLWHTQEYAHYFCSNLAQN